MFPDNNSQSIPLAHQAIIHSFTGSLKRERSSSPKDDTPSFELSLTSNHIEESIAKRQRPLRCHSSRSSSHDNGPFQFHVSIQDIPSHSPTLNSFDQYQPTPTNLSSCSDSYSEQELGSHLFGGRMLELSTSVDEDADMLDSVIDGQARIETSQARSLALAGVEDMDLDGHSMKNKAEGAGQQKQFGSTENVGGINLTEKLAAFSSRIRRKGPPGALEAPAPSGPTGISLLRYALGLSNILKKNAHDVVFVSALRTPVTRAKKGGFKDAYPEELLSFILKATLEKTKIDPAKIEDVCIGSVLQELGGAKAGRMSMIHGGYPYTVCFNTVNRQCSSGLQAITNTAHAIQVGQIGIGIGGGMESMTRNYGSRAIPVDLSPELRNSPVQDALDCIMPMGITSENVAERYGVSREEQDAFAVLSHKKAAAAQKAGFFAEEIVPTPTRWINPENPEDVTNITVSADDGIRANASIESMAKLKPAFKDNGTSTAGNSSQVSDGAAVALMMRRDIAERLGYVPIGKFVATTVAGVKPDEMGVGPAVAIPKLFEMTGISKHEVDIFELNEAFASQAIYCMKKLDIDPEKVNPKGGAIALGHPLGATGARQLATLLPELKRQEKQVGVISMCIGTGSGMASLIVRE
ncbi:hypothetical protein RUND412_004305 [Rhizina undulata]